MAWHRIVPMKKVRLPGKTVWVRRPTKESAAGAFVQFASHPVGAAAIYTATFMGGYYAAKGLTALGTAVGKKVNKIHAARARAALKSSSAATPKKVSRPSRAKYHPSRYRPGGGYDPNEPRDYHGRWTR
jgi:hypothetical protein